MDCAKIDPLSLAEAKQRVRDAAAKASPEHWVREEPITALLTAFTVGVTLGGTRDAASKVQSAVSFLVRQVLEKKDGSRL